jgi:hypothetical protein
MWPAYTLPGYRGRPGFEQYRSLPLRDAEAVYDMYRDPRIPSGFSPRAAPESITRRSLVIRGLPLQVLEERLQPRYRVAQSGSRERKTENRQSFKNALDQLYKQLVEAEALYRNFLTEYEKDVAAIKPYAGTQILDELWRRKMKGNVMTRRKSGASMTKSYGSPKETSSTVVHEEQFDDIKSNVLRSLEKAMTVTIPSDGPFEDSTSQDDFPVLLLEKICMSQQHLEFLFERAPAGKGGCSQLVNEIEQLKRLVDTKGGKDALSQKASSATFYPQVDESIEEEPERNEQSNSW